MNPVFASEKLKIGEIYSRKSLAKIFHITDATLNTGVFKPKNHSSVWLFVTRKGSESNQICRRSSRQNTSLAGTGLRQKRSSDY
jgi:hypothetical protein